MTDHLKFLFESVMVATGELAITPKELCDHSQRDITMIRARKVFIGVGEVTGLNMKQLANALYYGGNSYNFRRMYDIPATESTIVWYVKAIEHFNFLLLQQKNYWFDHKQIENYYKAQKEL